jgi:hypothetical protein
MAWRMNQGPHHPSEEHVMAYVSNNASLTGVRLHGRTIVSWPCLSGRAGFIEFLTRPFKDVDDRVSYQAVARRSARDEAAERIAERRRRRQD